MILFRTQFAAAPELTAEMFQDFLTDWLVEKGSFQSKDEYDDSSEFEKTSEDGKTVIEIYKDDDRVACQLTDTLEDRILTSWYVFDAHDDVHKILIQIASDFKKAGAMNTFQTVLVPDAFLKKIFWEEYGGQDEDIWTDDKPVLIRKKNINIAGNVLLHKKQYLNPVVYVSPYANGEYPVNYEFAAETLLGVGHVMAEGSPVITKLVSEMTDGKNPSEGTVGVFLPDGTSRMFEPDGSDQTENVVSFTRDAMRSLAIPDRMSVSKIRYEHMKFRLETALNDKSAAKLYDSVLSDKDSEVASLKEKIDEMQKELSDVKYRNEALQTAFDKVKAKKSQDGVILLSTSEPFYENEIRDVIIKALMKEYDQIKNDKRAKDSRKAAVLKDLIDHNILTGEDDRIRDLFKDIVGKDRINDDAVKRLTREGFTVEKDPGNHWAVTFKGQEKYKTFLASTPSDCRGGQNAVAQYMNMLFGY